MTATNFDDYVSVMADEAPHALVLDWYRRLELTVRDYLAARGIECRVGRSAEAVIGNDRLLGSQIATEIGDLRRVRNSVAHSAGPVERDNAVAYARQCSSMIGVIWKAQDAHTA
ncbi:MAG: hypothetical protein ACJ8AK_06500 [Gemmatimonadaceae bacterium]